MIEQYGTTPYINHMAMPVLPQTLYCYSPCIWFYLLEFIVYHIAVRQRRNDANRSDLINVITISCIYIYICNDCTLCVGRLRGHGVVGRYIVVLGHSCRMIGCPGNLMRGLPHRQW